MEASGPLFPESAHQFGELAIFAEHVGLVTEIAGQLEQALLHRGRAGQRQARAAGEALAGKAERGVVLSGRPGKETVFHARLYLAVAAGLGAAPEPGENDVHRQVGQARFAEQGLGLFQARRGERPVSGPEDVGAGLKSGEQGADEPLVGDILSAPFFQTPGPVPVGEPMRGESEAALGLVGGAEAMSPPEPSRQRQSGEQGLLAPPFIPEAAHVGAPVGWQAGEVGGQQPAQAEQAGLPSEGGGGRGGDLGQGKHELAQAAHRPDVVFVAKGGEQAFAERLGPTGLAGAGLEDGGFELQSGLGGLGEEFLGLGGVELVERSSADARFDGGRRETGGVGEPEAELWERSIERVGQREGRPGEGAGGGGFPNDVENDTAVGGIVGVMVLLPATRGEVDFDVAAAGRVVVELDDGLAEVRSGLAIPHPRMKNDEAVSVQRAQGIAAQPLVQPDLL